MTVMVDGVREIPMNRRGLPPSEIPRFISIKAWSMPHGSSPLLGPTTDLYTLGELGS